MNLANATSETGPHPTQAATSPPIPRNKRTARTNTTCIFGTSRQGQRPRAPAGKALLCQLQRIEHTLLTLHNVVESDTSNSSPHHVHKETILCEADTRSRSPTPVLPANDKAVSKVDPISNERWLDNHPEGYLDIMTLLGIEEMGILFNIYFESMNSQFGLLLRDCHTPSFLLNRNRFLLASVCAIAARFYPERPELHTELTLLVRKWVPSLLLNHCNTIENVQACLVLTIWGYSSPADHCERDSTWMLLGIAIRIAVEMGLYCNKDKKLSLVEQRNYERTWLICCIMDLSLSIQRGKPRSIIERFWVDFGREWLQKPEAVSEDFGLVSHWKLLRVLSDSVESLQTVFDMTTSQRTIQVLSYLQLITSMENQINEWRSDWSDSETRTYEKYKRTAIIQRYYYYLSMLIINSFGLQHSLKDSRANVAHFFMRCYTISMSCAALVRDELGPSGLLKYGPDAYIVLASYSALTLLKLLRPNFSDFVDGRLKEKIYASVAALANVLESVANHPEQLPALYGRFLHSLIPQRHEAPPVGASGTDQQPSKTPIISSTTWAGTQHMNDFLSMSDYSFIEPLDTQLFSQPSFSFDYYPEVDQVGLSLSDGVFGNSLWDCMFLPESTGMTALAGKAQI
ncbi:Protein priB [Ceratobasidium theobromae]|uniref:Protein priB n=1 Tax=Ceratobasidium theobromae TaxID=1582974 RepID=A0A5N5QGE9_9AGAM|nr:Protein priB [Ceratobasidium theobromae]